MSQLDYKQKYIQIFFRFLKENNAYGAFIKRFHRHYMRDKDYFLKKQPVNYLITAFPWDNEINWVEINTKWYEKIGY